MTQSIKQRMITVSMELIQAGRRTINDVPDHLRQQVQDSISAAGQPQEGQ